MPAFDNLTQRLSYLAELTLAQHQYNDYQCIYDTCCDHGYLGMFLLKQLLQQGSATGFEKLIFVDQVKTIMTDLAKPLAYFPQHAYQIKVASLEDLRLSRDQRQLLIVAGIGGTLLSRLLKQLLEINSSLEFDLLLCPSNEVYTLRDFLGRNCFDLKHEAIVADRGRYYEALLVSYRANRSELQTVTDIGQMWHLESERHRVYQQQLLAHYRRKLRSNDTAETQSIIAAYEAAFNQHNDRR